MQRRFKDFIKRILFEVYKHGTRMGIHILPVHHYSPLPNIIELEKTKHQWAKKSSLPGIKTSLEEQAKNIDQICTPFSNEYTGNNNYKHAIDNDYGPGFGYIEAQALHAVVRHYKPNKVIEIGSGVSTYCMLQALKLNRNETGHDYSVTCIEPYPSMKLSQLGGITLIPQQVQTVPQNLFNGLGKNDLLFIDSTHTVKPGSDVNYLILEVIPRLRSGIIIHFHDINFPYDYQRSVLQTFFHWTETSLLRALLINNNRIKILFCLSMLHYESNNTLRKIFPEYDPELDKYGLRTEYRPFRHSNKHFPASIYLQTY